MCWVCDSCSAGVTSHPCRALYRPHEAEGRALEDGLEVLTCFRQMDAQAIDFAVLGNLAEGRMLAVKEGDNVVLIEATSEEVPRCGAQEAPLFEKTVRLSAKVKAAYSIVDAQSTGCVEKINGVCHKLLTNCQDSS